MMVFVIFVALVAAAALSGAAFSPGPWYAELAKPPWTPPDWVFPFVWGVLYLLIAIAGWLVWTNPKRRASLPALWGIQLGLNALWSWIFFGLHRPGVAFAEIAALWLTIAAFILLARHENRIASLLFALYLLWVTFAAALNFAIWQLNLPSVG